MLNYIVKRVIQAFITIFIILTIVFFLFQVAMPGDPVDMMVDPNMTPEAREAIKEQFGLDKPAWQRYFFYVKSVFQLDFGRSFYYQTPVWERIKSKVQASALLLGASIILSYILGIFVGRISAWRRGKRFDLVNTFVGLFFRNSFIPFIGLFALWIFAFKGPLPLGGMLSAEVWSESSSGFLNKGLDVLKHMALPLSVLTIFSYGGAMLLMRDSMLKTLREDYITAARAKGLDEKTIRNKHAARNAMLPVITAFMLAIAFIFDGAVLTETVFSWPGIGKELVAATLKKDYPVTQAAFLLLGIMVVTMNLIADLAYSILDPRIRYER